MDGLDGAPVEALVAVEGPDGEVCAAAAGLAGVYLTLDGARTWRRHPGVDLLSLGCGFMDVSADAAGVVVRCRRGPEAATSCWRLGWDAASSWACTTAELRRTPLPEARVAHDPLQVTAAGTHLRAEPLRGVQRSLDGGKSWQPARRGMDGLAVVRITGETTGPLRLDLAVARAELEIHEGAPWARAGRATCAVSDEGVVCDLDAAPPAAMIPSRHEIVPPVLMRRVSGAPPTPVLALWPLSGGASATLLGSNRGLWRRR